MSLLSSKKRCLTRPSFFNIQGRRSHSLGQVAVCLELFSKSFEAIKACCEYLVRLSPFISLQKINVFFVKAFDVEADAVIDDLVDQVAEAVRHKEQA